MDQKIDANEVITELQSEIAEKSLQIALLKAQLKDIKKPTEVKSDSVEGQGDNE